MRILITHIAFIVLLLCSNILRAQSETSVDHIVNTVKERIHITGYGHVGYTYNSSHLVDNEFAVKRIVLTAKAKVTEDWALGFVYNLNSSTLQEFYTDYHFLPGLSVRLGQFKVPYTIENPISLTVVELINCYSQATNYLAGINSSDPLYGANSGRDVGIMLHGKVFKDLLTYNLGLFNGQGINKKDKNKNKDWLGSLTITPLEWLSFNGTFMKGKGNAVATSEYNTDIEIGENYRRDRWSGGIIAKSDKIYLRAEYLRGIDGKVHSEGYYINATIHLLSKLDVIASYDYFNRNKAIAAKQTNYIGGLQYIFYPKCRMQLQYVFSDGKFSNNAHVLQTQIQIAF